MDRNRGKYIALAEAAALALATLLGTASSWAGSLGGVVRFEGPRPERRAIRVIENRVAGPSDTTCAALHEGEPIFSEEELVAENGAVRNVFVYVKSGLGDKDFPLPTEAALIDQKGCMYLPHVQGMRVGQELNIVNSDKLMHNVRGFPKRNRAFNIGQPVPGTRVRKFRRAETAIKFQCDVHKWMTAFVFVMDHPFFAVTGEDGKFSIDDLPPGEYTIAAWHEVYGESEAEVKIGDGSAEGVDFTFHPIKK